jgi:hypothetical protein
MSVGNISSRLVLAGATLGSVLCLGMTPRSIAGEQKLDGLRVVAEPVLGKNCQFLRLYLENTTAKPVEIRDGLQPAFTVDQWITFKVDGVPVEAKVRGVHSLMIGETKLLPAKAKSYIGAAVLRVYGATAFGGYTPILNLQPGKHALEVSSKKGVNSTKLEVTVPAKAAPVDPAPGAFPEPELVLSLTQAKHVRNALLISMHVLNRTDRKLQFPHDGEEPPWHTGPWFDLEVNGKAYQPKIRPLAAPKEKGFMTIKPLDNEYRGELLIPLHGFDEVFFKNNHYYTPILPLDPGKYNIRVIPTKRWFQPGITPPLPASIDIVVPAAKKAN